MVLDRRILMEENNVSEMINELVTKAKEAEKTKTNTSSLII